MIVPDAKNWTWVLERRCPDCGFDASTCTFAAVPALVRGERGAVGRAPRSAALSTLVGLTLLCGRRSSTPVTCATSTRSSTSGSPYVDGGNPLYPNWDQDASAVADRYEEQEPAAVVTSLVAAAEAMAARLEGIGLDDQQRPGRRGDGALFTVDTIARYMLHDPIHHVWDVTTSG